MPDSRKSFPRPEVCRDYGQREGCTITANPKNTMKPEDYGSSFTEDLHFCDGCYADREEFFNDIVQQMAEGWLSLDDVKEAVTEAEEAERMEKE